MQQLEKSLRKRLEETVKEARDIAEPAARAALEQLGVGEAAPYNYLTDSERELRRKLRAHGRQLGDARNNRTETQEIDRLIEEVAYEHWHRMLFARFLAENNLLMYPDPVDPVAVTLDECEDLAADEGAKNGWELASRFAAGMLPQIFRPDSPVFQLDLLPEHQQKLERLLAELPGEVFTASDSLGWVYQFWQAKKKDEVNASEVKIGARELPAVTQLFTEPYMVAFLLDNSLGAWWAARRLSDYDLKSAKSELEVRIKAALPSLPLEYLRFVRHEDGTWAPAGGMFKSWPNRLSELKILDPCCGSGHFLVTAFLMLVPMWMEIEKLSVHGAVDAVLRDNLHGLEIDRRCTEIAAFNLALAAWRLTGYRPLPALNIACTGLSLGDNREQWMTVLDGQGAPMNLRFFFGQLFDLFRKAPTLGSLINPHRFLGSGLLDEKSLAHLHRVLFEVIAEESKSVTDRHEMGIAAQGLVKAAELLIDHYTLVVTNVPYLGRGKQDEVLREHLETHYPLGKADLATAFLLRCLEFCVEGGTTALVTPQNWLFLTAYTKLRQTLLTHRSVNIVVRLGEHAFETTAAAGAFAAMSAVSTLRPSEDHVMAGIDVSAQHGQRSMVAQEKAAMLRGEKAKQIDLVKQTAQMNNPDARIALEPLSGQSLLSNYTESLHGQGCFDSQCFNFLFWELPAVVDRWVFQQSAPTGTGIYTGCSLLLRWENGEGMIAQLMRAKARDGYTTGKWKAGVQIWGRKGIVVSLMRRILAGPYCGYSFDDNVAVLAPFDDRNLPAIYAFSESGALESAVRSIDQKLNVPCNTVAKIPFDLVHWQKVGAEKYPHGLPEPESDDPTQWLFHGRPEHSTWPLQVSVARLLGYRWPAEQDEKMRLSQRARDLVRLCDELLPFADKDGIVCIPPVGGEASAADRLLNLLAKVYGKGWDTDVLGTLLKDVGFVGKTLESWLRDGFFAQHCELFHQRPFIWQIWDGLRDGFSALVNYHKLDRKNLETLIYTYLGDWISRLKVEAASSSLEKSQDGSSTISDPEEKLAAAEALKRRLELILEGEAPYDIFVRWKSLHAQPIGWEPDLNDGVRMNIRPFMSVPDVKTKDAGVLRTKPRIKWEKDRGKEPKRPFSEYPWFWGWDGTVDFAGGLAFTGDRFNDCHYTITFKRQVRQQCGK